MTATNAFMIAPVGVNSVVGRSGNIYTADSNGVVSVLFSDIGALLNAGFTLLNNNSDRVFVSSPLPADLISVVAAVTPSNVALIIAAQPPHARKLQIRIVIGTTTTTAITAGTLTLVGTDQDGNAVSEVISLIENASATVKSKWAYAALTSATVAAYAASGSGTGNTVGLGVSNDFGVQTTPGVPGLNLICVKSTKTTKVLGTSNIAVDDVASTTTVDTVARTIAPTTAPAANGLVDFDFTYTFGIGA